jgi:hypothetical protein
LSLFDDVSDVFGGIANVAEGGIGTAESAVDFVGDVLEGDVIGATRDAYDFVENAKDVLEGVRDLGVSIGTIPSRFVDNPILQLADSPPIELAQRIIAGMRLTTGSGDPVEGAEYEDAAKLMQEGLELLIDAAPHEDHWNGAASEAYADRNKTNRLATSAVQVADLNIADVLQAEAHQVVQTRKTLDDIDEYLFQFALSTAWMNGIPGGRAAKLVVDSGAAALGLGGAGRALTSLVTDSYQRSEKIREQFEHYEQASGQKSLGAANCDGPFVSAETDREEKPPARFNNPEYTVPDPVDPPPYGPPATPYGASPGTTQPAAPSLAPPRHPSVGSAPPRGPIPVPSRPSSTSTPPTQSEPSSAPRATSTQAAGIGGTAPLAAKVSAPTDHDLREAPQ